MDVISSPKEPLTISEPQNTSIGGHYYVAQKRGSMDFDAQKLGKVWSGIQTDI